MTKPTTTNNRDNPLDIPSLQQLSKLLLPLSRKVSWAIGSTYYDLTGLRLPRKMVDSTADAIATDFIQSLQKYLNLASPPEGEP